MKEMSQQEDQAPSRAASPPHVILTDGFETLDPAVKIEEEVMVAYDMGLFYPVRIGDVIKSRYQVLTKLGYGANSTVWLCRDLEKHCYIALKIHICSPRSQREAEILQYLAGIDTIHPGKHKIRMMRDGFEIDSPVGSHPCLVQEPHLTSLLHLQASFPGRVLEENMLKPLLNELLIALDYLHLEANVVHTDIQAKNIMIGTTAPSLFAEWEEEENENPRPRKVTNGHVVYRSRRFSLKEGLKGFGKPILADFGEARIGTKEGQEYEGLIQPDLYRAPEVVLGMKWNSKVDVWNLGVLIWDLFEPDHLFNGCGPDGEHSPAHLLAEMVALLGHPPVEFLKKSPHHLTYWDEEGTWRGLAQIPDISLEDLDVYLEGENLKLFLQFLRKMLTWDPEERPIARELLADPWLRSGWGRR